MRLFRLLSSFPHAHLEMRIKTNFRLSVECLLDLAFSSIILFQMFDHAFDIFKIPVHHSGTSNTFKKLICLNHLHMHFLLLCQFYMNGWTQKAHDLTYHEITVGSLGVEIAFMWSNRQIPVTSILRNIFLCACFGRFQLHHYFFEVSILIFCVQIWPLQSYHTVCFQILAKHLAWSILEISILHSPQQVSIVQFFF